VAVGVLRDPTRDVRQYHTAADDKDILSIVFREPLSTAADAEMVTQQVKSTVLKAANRVDAGGIDLFYVGPAALAVALGHRWNGMPPTQVYEFDPGKGMYFPAAVLSV
jgi:2-keto-3-deoxy-L-rhamnonate aldolase RhmA